MTIDLSPYRNNDSEENDFTEFVVHALDGPLGAVDAGTYDLPTNYLVVATRSRGGGKKVVLPATVIEYIDEAGKAIYVHRTLDEIERAPEFDEARFHRPASRAELGRYYGPGGAGHRVSRPISGQHALSRHTYLQGGTA